MLHRSDRRFAEEPERKQDRIRRLVSLWNELDVHGESGATTLEVLESLRLQVTDCLAADPPDITRAESITAHAFLLIAGSGDDL
jgi:hypothetical protein